MTTNGFKKMLQSIDSVKPFDTIPRYPLNEEDCDANVERRKPSTLDATRASTIGPLWDRLLCPGG
jgi:hypothetical protein